MARNTCRSILVTFGLLVAVAPGLAVADDGWQSLFDGRTLNGWTRASRGVAEYNVRDGAIHGVTVEGSENTFLASAGEYGDFELEFEVKVHNQLNSGVQIRSREQTKEDGKEGRFFGPQVEIEASPGQAGYVYGEATGLGWLSEAPKDKSHSHDHIKNNEWNSYRVVAKGARIQTWINGQKVADLTHDGIYRTHPKGKIGLQVHGIKRGSGPFDVSWRSIRIKQL
ncbi:MAG: DUF1080 domain-containing protein [Fuerstiella sp.]|jgi:hypothetical protein|nr:DUF1080 domain-containing protein [Fuerstiella sp.]